MKTNKFSKGFLFICSLACSAYSIPTYSASLDMAVRLYQKLAGIPPTSDDMILIQSYTVGGDSENIDLGQVADLAIGTKSFLTTTVKSFASPMSNISAQSTIDLNDFTATVIGVVRDDVQMDKLLYDDILYMGDVSYLAASPRNITVSNYSQFNNYHYRDLEMKGVDLRDPSQFIQVKQSEHSDSRSTAISADATMGVMTTRAAGEAFMKDGTNRRMIRFILVDFMCKDMENMHDTTLSDFRVRQDVPRNAGGDSRTYLNTCKGCHAGMDALGGAFAFYDWKGFVIGQTTMNGMTVNLMGSKVWRNDVGAANEAANGVVDKMIHNVQFYDNGKTIGYKTVDDSFVNLWTAGQNSVLGFREPASVAALATNNPGYVTPTDPKYGDITHGSGAKALGIIFANTAQFGRCMAQRAYAQVCNRKAPFTSDENALFNQLGASFDQNGHLGKALFKDAAIACVNNQGAQ